MYFGGFGGEAELISRILRAKENTFRELRNFLSGIWGDQCVIFGDQGSRDPLGDYDMLKMEGVPVFTLFVLAKLQTKTIRKPNVKAIINFDRFAKIKIY